MNTAAKSKSNIKKIFTGAGYSLSWSFRKNIFAVISYCDKSKESYDINTEALNNEISKAKLARSGVKSAIIFFRIEKEKLRKINVWDQLKIYSLYNSGPFLSIWYNKFQKKDAYHQNIEGNKAMCFLSWKNQEVLTDPITAPEHIEWSNDWNYYVLGYNDFIGIYCVEKEFKLIKKHYVRCNHWKIFGEFLFIVTDDAIYVTIITYDQSELYEIASSDIAFSDAKKVQEMANEETKQSFENNEDKPIIRPPLAIKILALCKNMLVLQLYNGSLKWININNEIFNFAVKLKSSEIEKTAALKYYEENQDKQIKLYGLVKWAGLESRLSDQALKQINEIGTHFINYQHSIHNIKVPEIYWLIFIFIGDSNYTECLKYVTIMKVLNKINQKSD